MGCEFMRCEWIVRNHPLLCITSLNSGVTSYLDLDQSVYGWVECPSEASGCTSIVKI
jgi:hypothetical protein